MTVDLKTIRNAIPTHLFRIRPVVSMAYLLRDIALVSIAGAGGYWMIHSGTYWLLPVYTLVQGVFFTSLWVIAHECGHRAFHPNRVINHSVGFILHSLLITPYFSWKFSHCSHHKHTNNIQQDEVHVPTIVMQPLPENNSSAVKQSVYRKAIQVIGLLLWVPLAFWVYLTANVSSGKKYDRLNKWVHHFSKNSPVFSQFDVGKKILISNSGVITALILVGFAIVNSGFFSVFWLYITPLLVNMFLLASYTKMHHTKLGTIWYASYTWDYVKGQSQTIDNTNLGFFNCLNYLNHNINDTHVCHHFFPSIPHYNAVKATPYIKAVLGDDYKENKRGFFVTLLTCFGLRRSVVRPVAPGVYAIS